MIEQFLQKMDNLIVPKSHSLNTIKKESTNNKTSQSFIKPDINTGTFAKVISYDDEDNLKDVIANEKKKNMNLRYQVSELTKKNEYLIIKIEKQNDYILKLEKQMENDSKYLIKLESMFNNRKEKVSKSNNMSNDESERNSLIKFLIENNEKYKRFQEGIYEISKNHDQINDEMIYNLGEIQSLLQFVNEKISCDESIQHINFLKNSFNKVITNLEDLIENKQSEYLLLLTEKENELERLKNDNINLKELIEVAKSDRMKDQHSINLLQKTNELLEARISAYNIKVNDSSMNSIVFDKKQIMKKVEPLNKSVKRSINKIENNFNLTEVGNVNLLEKLNYKLKI